MLFHVMYPLNHISCQLKTKTSIGPYCFKILLLYIELLAHLILTWTCEHLYCYCLDLLLILSISRNFKVLLYRLRDIFVCSWYCICYRFMLFLFFWRLNSLAAQSPNQGILTMTYFWWVCVWVYFRNEIVYECNVTLMWCMSISWTYSTSQHSLLFILIKTYISI